MQRGKRLAPDLPINLRPSGRPRHSGLPTDIPMESGSASASNSRSVRSETLQASRLQQLESNGTSEHSTTSENAIQEGIHARLKEELNGAVLNDPNFSNMVPLTDAEFEHISRHCRLYNSNTKLWSAPPGSGQEQKFYAPTMELLNAIGEVAHLMSPNPLPYVPFIDTHNRILKSTYPGMETAPDIIKCERPNSHDKYHWHDVHLFVEVGPSGAVSDVKLAVQQSARYARSLFAHRIDRRFIITLVACDRTAVFLRFDRSGLVYSTEIDIYTEAEQFLRAFAGLLRLDHIGGGYNPMFQALWGNTANNETTLAYNVILQKTIYAVQAVLCNRKSIRSRATLVLALRRLHQTMDYPAADQTISEDDVIDAVLKLLWRDPTRFREGLILQQFIGIYGICQLIDEGDVEIAGHPDVVYPRIGLAPGPRGNIFGNPSDPVDLPGAQLDDGRTFSMLVMQPGRPLWEADDSYELQAALTGAIMGHWALVGSNVQHRDVSVYNILLPHNEFEYKQPEWDKLDVEARAKAFKAPDWGEIFNKPGTNKFKTVEELKWKFDPRRRLTALKKVIGVLGEKPRGFLSDVDMANMLSLRREKASEMHTHRTGTLPFMAVDLLLPSGDAHVPHSFLHDLESFFWVLLYVVADHQENDGTPNAEAQFVIARLSQIGRSTLVLAKSAFLSLIDIGKLDISSFKTSWAVALAPVIKNFATWVLRIQSPTVDSTTNPDSYFEEVLEILLPDEINFSESEPVEGTAKQASLLCTAHCQHELCT